MSDVTTEPQFPPPVDDASITWEDFTSKNGVGYSVGTFKAAEESDPADSDSNARFAFGPSKEIFGMQVEWPLGDSTWKSTGPEIREKAAITHYAFSYNDTGPGSFFTRYEDALWFTNTDTFNYYFYDETGDSYHVNTWRTGNHVVRFGSKKPKIVFITGS